MAYKKLSTLEISDISAATGIGNISEGNIALGNDVILVLKLDEEDFISIRSLSRIAEFFGVSQEDVLLEFSQDHTLMIDILGQSVFKRIDDNMDDVDDSTGRVDDNMDSVYDSDESWEASEMLNLLHHNQAPNLGDQSGLKPKYDPGELFYDLHTADPEPALPFIEHGGKLTTPVIGWMNPEPIKKDGESTGCCGTGGCPGCPSRKK